MESIFKVVSCNPSNSGKTFVWKLEIAQTAKAFGITKTVKRTYYIGGMPQAATIGAELKEDLSKFDIVARPFTPDPSQEDPEPETIMLKWLHVKVGA
jgi:hypothetical protein